jgi:SAM-dependent methyltransferase
MIVNEDFSLRSKIQDVGRWYVNRFVESVAQSLPAGTSILDAGAGECVYKKFFYHCNYKSIDLAVGESRWNYTNLDYVGPLHDMPLEDGIFDSVLCTEVLEHLEWPRESVKEMYRVLRPGGKLYLTVPMAHSEHQAPYDFFRYTSYGLNSICKHAGFEKIDITPFGGLWVRWAYELPRGLSVFPPSGLRSKSPNPIGIALLPARLIAMGIVRSLQVICFRLDRFDKEKNDPFGWACVATK